VLVSQRAGRSAVALVRPCARETHKERREGSDRRRFAASATGCTQ